MKIFAIMVIASLFSCCENKNAIERENTKLSLIEIQNGELSLFNIETATSKNKIKVIIAEKKVGSKFAQIISSETLLYIVKSDHLSSLNFNIKYPIEIKDPITIALMGRKYNYEVSANFDRGVINDSYEISNIFKPNQLADFKGIRNCSYLKLSIDSKLNVYCIFFLEEE